MTRAQRRQINRANARKSTGPNDTSRTRFNALKHGLRAEVAVLPDEDPAVIRARSDAWNDFYQPQSPAEQHLVNQCVRATLLADRVDTFHAAELSKQIREAPNLCIDARIEDRDRCIALLATDPRAAVRGLEQSGFGCQYLLDRWEELDAALVKRGHWCETERDEAIRLIGHGPDPKGFKTCPEAWITRLLNLLVREAPSERMIAWMFDHERLPDLYRERYTPTFVPDREECMRSLRAMIAVQVERLRPLEEEYRTMIDEPDLAESGERALILRDEATARLFLRYHAESRTSFHRAYSALSRAIDERDEEAVSVPELAASPSEANGASEALISPIAVAACGDAARPDSGGPGCDMQSRADGAGVAGRDPNHPGQAATVPPSGGWGCGTQPRSEGAGAEGRDLGHPAESPSEANGADEGAPSVAEDSTSGESRAPKRARKSRRGRYDPKQDVALLLCDLYHQEVAAGRGADLVPMRIIGSSS